MREIIQTSLDVNVVIPLLKDVIQEEHVQLEANKIIKNPIAYLNDDYKISHLKILLDFLSRSNPHEIMIPYDLEVKVVTPVLKDLIHQEYATLEANKILNNQGRYSIDYKITHLKILLALLNGCRD